MALVYDLKAGTDLRERARAVERETQRLLIAARVGTEVIGLSTVLQEDASVEFLTFDSEEAREVYRHTASHVMAQAVKRLFPQARLGIGPAIMDGFYYDFDLPHHLTEEDLPRIEEEMKKIVAEDIPIERVEVPRAEAVDVFSQAGERFKVELLEELTDETVSIYRQAEFSDLCRGPHLPTTGRLKSFKLTSVAGAYWRGDERRPMLQRIYGTAFEDEAQLEDYLGRLEEAKKRDHRRLGIDLDLYSIREEAGAGLVYWHANGSLIRKLIERFWEDEHVKRGYRLLYTPHIARAGLWKASGHFDYYRENMYVLKVDDEDYVLKPMNCVGHILVYKSRKRSYRDLPIRYAEMGTVYRRERSGTLHGLMRVRGFTQDDAHIFCTREQIVDEVIGVIDLYEYLLSALGFKDYQVDLSVRDPARPQDYAGSPRDWEEAERALAGALERKGIDYRVAKGEAVFYGPNLPGRLGVEYVGEDGRPHNVVMIHRTVLGGIERFFGVLIEHYGGAFPLWLSPVQVSVLPVKEEVEQYAGDVCNALAAGGVRAETTSSQQKLGYRIRQKTMEKIPYILVVGERERASRTVAVRKRGGTDKGAVPLEEFVGMVKSEIEARSLD